MSFNASKKVQLASCATFKEGYVNPSQKDQTYFGNDIKWLRATDLNDGFVFNTSRGLSEKGFASAGKSALLFEPGTLAISKSGTIGRIGILKDFMCGNRAVINIKVNPECDTRFIFYTLLLNRQKIETLAEGSVQKNLYVSSLGKLEFDLPSLEHQKRISETMGALDDRITLLRETNATLEAIAQAMFKSWFVDFDPVHAKQQGRVPEGMDEVTAALFPDSFEESELGLVPKVWKVKPLDEIAEYLNGLALQKFPPENDGWLPVIKIAQLRKGNTVGADRASRKIKREYVIKNGDVLFSWSGSLEVEVWCGGEGALNQHLFKVTSEKYPKWFYYFWTKYHLESFRQTAASKATTMGHIQRGHLSQAKVVVPPEQLVSVADQYLTPLLDRWISNALHAQNLTTLRDTLLPRLISGQLKLRDTEALLESN
jgi:type I restriction enzyme S subunit